VSLVVFVGPEAQAQQTVKLYDLGEELHHYFIWLKHSVFLEALHTRVVVRWGLGALLRSETFEASYASTRGTNWAL
jgi:hypothetical protein